MVDEESGLPYYWHEESNTTQWEAPIHPVADLAADRQRDNGNEGGDAQAGICGADAAALHVERAADPVTGVEERPVAADAAAAVAGGASSSGAAAGRVASAARGRSERGRALPARAALAHARASAALSDALLATGLPSGAAELPLLRAELLVRQGDLAALRGALKEVSAAASAAAADDEGSGPALTVEAVVAVCQHVESHVRGVASRAAAAAAAAPALDMGGPSKAGDVGAAGVAANAAVGAGVGGIAEAFGSNSTRRPEAAEVEDGEVEDAAANRAATGSCAAGEVGGAGGAGSYMHETHAVSSWAQAVHAVMLDSGEEAVDPLLVQVAAVGDEEPPPLPEEPPPEEPPPGLEEEHAAMEAAGSAAAAPPLPPDDEVASVGVRERDRPSQAEVRGAAADATGASAADAGGASVGSGASARGKAVEARGDDGDAGARKRRRGPAEAAAAGAAGGSAKKPKKLKGRTSKLLDKWHNVARELEAEEVRGVLLWGATVAGTCAHSAQRWTPCAVVMLR